MTTDTTSQIYFDTYENVGMNESKKIEFTLKILQIVIFSDLKKNGIRA